MAGNTIFFCLITLLNEKCAFVLVKATVFYAELNDLINIKHTGKAMNNLMLLELCINIALKSEKKNESSSIILIE